MKKLVFLVCASFALLFAGFSASAAIPSNWPGTYTVSNGLQVWAPEAGFGTQVGTAIWNSATGGGLTGAAQAAPALADGRSVALTVTKAASNASIWTAVGRLASGPVGIAGALAIPYVYDWITADNGQNVRVNATKTGVERLVDSSIYQTQCGGGSWVNAGPGTIVQVATQCASNYTALYRSSGYPNCSYSAGPSSGAIWTATVGGSGCPNANFSGTATKVQTQKDWLPASMDDIAPYMTPRTPAPPIMDELAKNGIEPTLTPVSITGPTTPLTSPTPYQQTTQYPKGADQVTQSTTSGNPFNIPANTPTTTGSGTGTTTANPGSTTSTGTPPAGMQTPTPGPITVPTSRTDVSTYNPTTNQTTTTSTTKQDPYTQTTTTTSTTNITNTTTSSTAVTNNTTTTSLTNNTTNITNVTTNAAPAKNPDPVVDPCDKYPDRLGCIKEGETPASDVLKKTSQAVTVTATAFSSSSACPAPLNFNVRTASYSVSYQPLCDRLAAFRALFLAMAAVLAAWILTDSFKV